MGSVMMPPRVTAVATEPASVAANPASVSEAHASFLWKLISPEVVIRAVAYQPDLTRPAAEAMGVSVRTMQRWAAKARVDGHRCDCACDCITYLHSLRVRCFFCERHHPEGQDEQFVAAMP